jgi:hypothetical protein
MEGPLKRLHNAYLGGDLGVIKSQCMQLHEAYVKGYLRTT